MIKMNPFLTVKELHDMCKEHPCDCDFPKPCNLKGIGICPSHETPDEWNIAEPDRPKICYLLDPEHPLEVEEKFNLPGAGKNPHCIAESGIIKGSYGFASTTYNEIYSIFSCINGERHIERLPSYPDFTDAEVEALKWYNSYSRNAACVTQNHDSVMMFSKGEYKETQMFLPTSLFPHITSEYTLKHPLDIAAYLKRREQK
jgi:hypothetical protein